MYALYLEVSTLKAVKIELPSGQITANVKVTGFNSLGEMTRLFTYDERRARFYYLEVGVVESAEVGEMRGRWRQRVRPGLMRLSSRASCRPTLPAPTRRRARIPSAP